MQFKLKPLSEQTIVITGIGLCTTRMAAERGANVVAVDAKLRQACSCKSK